MTISQSIKDGSTLQGSVTWTAVPSQSINHIDFLIDGVKKWTEGAGPYQFNGDPNGVLNTSTLPDGSHAFEVQAFAADGSKVASNVVHATVANGSAPPPPPPPPSSGSRLFADDSPINQLIGANPSVVYPLGFAVGRTTGIGVNNNNGWSVGIFRNNPGSRRTVVSGSWHLDNVPMPSQFQAYWDAYNVANAEWHTVIIDGDRVFNIYKPDRGLATSHAHGCFRPIDGSGARSRGVWDANKGPWIGRASGFCSALGCLLNSEFKAGKIEHALACCWPKGSIRQSGPVSPATVSDGSGGAGAIPMGTRMQLDPALSDSDMAGLGIPSEWLPVCHAMQNYGVFICESSSWMALYAEAWNDNGRTSGWTNFSNADKLLSHFRAVAPPPLPPLDDRDVFGQPHQ